MTTSTTFLLETQDGAPVVVHRWEPPGEVRGIVNIAHGIAEHAARYGHVAEACNGVGIAVYAQDHRGHGESARSQDDRMFFAEQRGWATVLDDLHRVTLQARRDHPRVPIVLLGHSMGSYFAQQYLFTFGDELDGLVLSGSQGPVGLRADLGAVIARLERRRIGRRGRSPLLERIATGSLNRRFSPARTEFDWLSRDTEQVDRYLADPWCGLLGTTQLYLDLASGVRLIGQVERVRQGARKDLPIYVVSGSDDPLGGVEGVRRLLAHYEDAGLTGVEHQLYEGARHEILNETNRDEVVADLLAWLERRVLAEDTVSRERPDGAGLA